jgi:hypothetical protein
MDQAPDVIEEPKRHTPVVEDVDVLVAGGGPAGIAAALCAAKEGARTCLVERYGYLGGMITGAHVVAILGVGDGYKPLARGITLEIWERLDKLGGVSPIRGCGDYRVDAEMFKWQALEMLLELGVKVRLHTLACEAVVQGSRVSGVLAESKGGRQAFRAQVVIDTTADADLAYRAGCPCDNEPHEVTLGYVVEGVDKERVEVFRRESPAEYETAIVEAMELNGGMMLGQRQLLRGIDITRAEDLTQAEIQLRRGPFRALLYLREHLPGYENARISVTRPQIGGRQSRRVRGEYILANDDLKASRHFDDGVARLGVYFPDWGAGLRAPNYAIKGLSYDIPYRSLVPETVDGMLIAGRCISCDYVACNTMRLIVPCLATGQAAGVAADLAVKSGCAPRDVDVETLRARLRAQDVYLG